MAVEQVVGSENTFRVIADKLDGGWSTRTFPTQLPDNKLFVADNVVYSRDGIISKRPGNAYYGSGASSSIGSHSAVLSLCRFYPVVGGAGVLLAHSGTQLWRGNDATGAWTAIAGVTLSAANAARFTPMYDPDMSSGAATAVFITDGVHIPQLYDGTHVAAVQQGGIFLPLGRSGASITPLYTCSWDYHLCYAGQPDEPTALYISDALRPERFTGVNYIDSATSSYVPYYPAGRDGTLGAITGIVPLGATLVIFYEGGIVAASNTGTYGATQYVFTRVSSTIGATAPRSIVAMDSAIFFFAGDKFYATDAQSLSPLADDIPSVYAHNARSVGPPEIQNPALVYGCRRGSQYWASYDWVGAGQLGRIVMFDTSANGGWNYITPSIATTDNVTQGGAWTRWPTGMPLNCAVECRGGNDRTTFPFFWGMSTSDTVAQHDAGTFLDFAAPILCQIQTKSYYLEKPTSPKTIQGGYILGLYQSGALAYTTTITPYCVEDFTVVPATNVAVPVRQSAMTYGSGATYGAVSPVYQAGGTSTLIATKFYPQQIGPCTAVAMGVIESSPYAFAVVGFEFEVTVDAISP